MQTLSNSSSKPRSYRFKRRLRNAIIAVLIAVGVRATVAQAFYVPSNAVEPEIPRHARILVYKLTHTFQPGDIVAYRNNIGEVRLGRVTTADASTLTVSRTNEPQTTILRNQIIGRVVLTTR